MTKGLIAMPYTEVNIIDVTRRNTSLACRGYDWLGYRPFPRVLVIHRAQSLNSPYATESGYYASTCCPALTDLEVNHITGHAKRYVNLPGDSPSGWASGPISAPYGDGKLFNDRYPYLVNTLGESCEFLGRFAQPGTNSTIDDPVSPEAQEWASQWMASRAHDYGIKYVDFPLVIWEGHRSYITWHREYTIGTGKVCPGPEVMRLTPLMINRAREIMKVAQLSSTNIPPITGNTKAPDGLAYPMGLDAGICTIMFGVLTKNGKRFSFNPAGVISKAWYKRGKASGIFPFLYDHFADVTTGREYFFFSDGSAIWKPDSEHSYMWAF